MKPIARPRPQRGAATLAVVMVLFFILAMVAAYTNRNMIFEQRTSANGYRATQALAAADASLDWTIAMLNGGAIDLSCSSTAAGTDFRGRYLTLESDGKFTPVKWDGMEAQFSCVANGAGWSCGCPTAATAALPVAPGQVFMARFDNKDVGLPGVITVRARGCDAARSGLIDGGTMNSDSSCHVAPLNTDTGSSAKVLVDSQAGASVSLGLVSALPVAPIAALTARGDVTQAAGATLYVTNQDSETGLAVRAGVAITGPITSAGPSGSTGSTTKPGDADLGAVAAADFMRQTLGLPPQPYGQQPAATYLPCDGGCNGGAVTFGPATGLVEISQRYPSRIVYVDGSLAINADTTLGTPTSPVMLVVKGDLNATAALTVNGVVYVDGDFNWSGGGSVNGAVIVGEDFSGSGAPAAISYNRGIVRQIRQSYGSFVRVPGTWTIEQGK